MYNNIHTFISRLRISSLAEKYEFSTAANKFNMSFMVMPRSKRPNPIKKIEYQ